MNKKVLSHLARTAAMLVLAVFTSATAWADDVTYLEYNTGTKAFDTKTCTTYTTVTDETTAWTAGWYVVNSDVTIETRISVTGDVHLILGNGVTFNATKGIACVEGNSLTIYGQSNDEATMGVLECGQSLLTTSPEWGYAAIGGGGKSGNTSMSPVNGIITIHGGKVLAHASAYGAAIGGGYGNQNDKKDFGTIVINGGIISADNGTIQSNAQCPAIIGGGTYMKRGNITINGGTVTAYNSNGGGQGALIGAGTESSWGIITINGGEITVSSKNMGAGIGGGVFLTSDDNMTDPELDQIIITGGTITATATYGGAAIGGGMKGKCGTICISGGTINASATYSAAIGNGNGIKVDGGNINITGGVINATTQRSPIGASQAGYGPAISISSTDAENDRLTLTPTGSMTGLGGSSVTIADGANITDVIKFAAAGYSTYYASQWDLTLPAGMKARIVTAAGDGESLTYETIADGDTETKNVPGGTAVLLQTAAADADQSFTVGLAAKTTYSGPTNLLYGSDVATTTTGGNLYYKLTYGSEEGHTDVFGWYWGADDGAAFTSPAHKAYLALPAGVGEGGAEDAKIRFFSLPDNTALGIENITATGAEAKGAWYTLSGVKLNAQPKLKGIYIRDGKKFIIK
ncbi:MAG: hypothetical protein IJT97_01900 [Bacteroidaceae bacterium]|nr:hypothetical protein [Bacteroidaceae bacterium]